MPTALALSPHLDDAAFSCGGTLALLAQAGWNVVMATVFTGSVAQPAGFALACQTDKGLAPDVDYMALRRREDEAAARALGLSPPRHLGFREAPHRGYGAASELFADPRGDDAVAPDLACAFGTLLEQASPDLVLAPQAVGGHVDHVQVVRALRSLAPAVPILWWRDFPYTVRSPTPREPLRDGYAALDPLAVRFGTRERARKAQACAAYATQLGFQFGGLDGLKAQLAEEGGTERFRVSGTLPDGFAAAIPDAGRG